MDDLLSKQFDRLAEILTMLFLWLAFAACPLEGNSGITSGKNAGIVAGITAFTNSLQCADESSDLSTVAGMPHAKFNAANWAVVDLKAAVAFAKSP